MTRPSYDKAKNEKGAFWGSKTIYYKKLSKLDPCSSLKEGVTIVGFLSGNLISLNEAIKGKIEKNGQALLIRN